MPEHQGTLLVTPPGKVGGRRADAAADTIRRRAGVLRLAGGSPELVPPRDFRSPRQRQAPAARPPESRSGPLLYVPCHCSGTGDAASPCGVREPPWAL